MSNIVPPMARSSGVTKHPTFSVFFLNVFCNTNNTFSSRIKINKCITFNFLIRNTKISAGQLGYKLNCITVTFMNINKLKIHIHKRFAVRPA